MTSYTTMQSDHVDGNRAKTDQLERPGERRRGDALAPVPLADEVAGDPPVRQGRCALLVGSSVLDLRHLVRRAELAPTHTVVAIEHKGRVRPACLHPCELAFPVQRRLAAVIRMKAHAPTTPEDAVIRLDQPRERIPARLIESLNRVPRSHHQLSLGPSTTQSTPVAEPSRPPGPALVRVGQGIWIAYAAARAGVAARQSGGVIHPPCADRLGDGLLNRPAYEVRIAFSGA